MTYYVDGDNLMHFDRTVHDGPAREAVRIELVRKIGINKENLRAKVVVVFDAEYGPRSTEIVTGVKVEYPPATADDRLVEIAHNCSKGIFVTNDKELRTRIIREGKQVISNADFMELLSPRKKRRPEKRQERDKAEEKSGLKGSAQDAQEMGLDPDDTIEI